MADDDKKQRIMQAAEALFAGGRIHEITTDEVARRAGVGKGTIYRFFEDKDHLFFETAHAGFDELCELLRRKVAPGASFARQLLQACVQISGFFERRRELFDMMMSEERRARAAAGGLRRRWREKRKTLVEAVAVILRHGVAEGSIRSDLPVEVLANFLLGMLRTRARDLADCPPAHKRYEVVVDVFCRGANAKNG